MSDNELVTEIKNLAHDVTRLRKELEKSQSVVTTLKGQQKDSQRTQKRLRNLILAGLAGVCIFAIFVAYYFHAHRELAQAAASANRDALVINCKNANDTRAANRAIWGFWITLLLQQNDVSPGQLRWANDYRDYINKAYAERDCNNLDKRYPLPDPPSSR